jgi:chromosome segregation ATPase
MKEWIQEARADAERARVHAEQTREDIKDLKFELQEHGRKTKRSGWSTAVLALALIGASIAGYYALQEHGASLAQIPVVQKALDSLGPRMSAAEETLRGWTDDWAAITARMDKVEKTAGTTLRAAKDYATQQSAKVHHEVQAEMDNRTQALQANISQLAAAQQEDRGQLAKLQDDVASARRETALQVAQVQRETGEDLRGLDGQIARTQMDIDSLSRHQDLRRLDFEVSKDLAREVAPGISLTVSDTNVSYQRVEGRIHVVPDGRILWIRGQGIEQPVRFYSHEDERAYEVVFTRVNKDGAIGYVLMPRWPNAGTPVAGSASTQSAGIAQ